MGDSDQFAVYTIGCIRCRIARAVQVGQGDLVIEPARCVRPFSEVVGDSHFEDIDMPMSAAQYAPPAPAGPGRLWIVSGSWPAGPCQQASSRGGA